MEVVHTDRENLKRVLESTASTIGGTPVYRMLHSKSLMEYSNRGLMVPKEGDYSVGCGVFFYMDREDVSRQSGTLVVVASMEKLSNGTVIDTRIPEYAKELISKGLQGWELWKEVLQHDTITTLAGVEREIPVYTHRAPVSKEDILFEIRIDN